MLSAASAHAGAVFAIDGTLNRDALRGSSYSSQLSATGGTAPLTWSLADGSTLPAGLVLGASNGVLSGNLATAGSFTFTVQVTDANSLVATKELRLSVLDFTTPSLPNGLINQPYLADIVITGGVSPYSWRMFNGITPPGMAVQALGSTASTFRIHGATASVGTHSFALEVTDAQGFKATRGYSFTIYASAPAPTLRSVSFAVAQAGVEYTARVFADDFPDTFTLTGLPKGLKYNARTGEISGRPLVAGVFNVRVSARNKGGVSAAVTAPLVVRPFPAGLVGTFEGLVSRGVISNYPGGRITLSTQSNGTCTVKITTGAIQKSATGFLAHSAPQVSMQVGGGLLSLTVSNNEVTGSYGVDGVKAYRRVWNEPLNPCPNLAGYYSIALQTSHFGSGHGFATFTLASSGGLSLAGRTGDGKAITSAGFLGPAGQICVYAGRGVLLGELILTADPGGLFLDNTAAGTLSRYIDLGSNFATHDVTAYGKYLAPKATGMVILGLPNAGEANLMFAGAGIEQSAQSPGGAFNYSATNVVTLPANPTQTSLSINKSTGAVRGKFTLRETTPPLVRKDNPFVGQVVRLADQRIKAVGYFLLKQMPSTGGIIQTPPVLPGEMKIEQP